MAVVACPLGRAAETCAQVVDMATQTFGLIGQCEQGDGPTRINLRDGTGNFSTKKELEKLNVL
jgi:hypothetical protein